MNNRSYVSRVIVGLQEGVALHVPEQRAKKVEFMELCWNEYNEHPGAAALPEIDQPIGTVVSGAAQPIGVIDQLIVNPGHSRTHEVYSPVVRYATVR